MPEPLTPGPALNRRVGEAMNVEPVGWRIYTAATPKAGYIYETREQAEKRAASLGNHWLLTPEYPDYSAPVGGAWEQARDWLIGQEWSPCFCWDHERNLWLLTLDYVGEAHSWALIEADGPTMALAVCAAVLAVRERKQE